jgi:hypothetical protein
MSCVFAAYVPFSSITGYPGRLDLKSPPLWLRFTRGTGLQAVAEAVSSDGLVGNKRAQVGDGTQRNQVIRQ